MLRKHRMKRRRDPGVSVAEATVGLAIASVCAIILFPVFQRAKYVGEDTKCLSNLRQVGVGILSYANDHDGRFPGPLNSAQYPYWQHYTQLSTYLANYLWLQKSREKTKDDVFICPAYKRMMRDLGKYVGESPVYVINIEVPVQGGARHVTPFGYANAQNPRTFGTFVNFPPMQLTSLSDISDEHGPAHSRVWMIKDADQLVPLRDKTKFNVPDGMAPEKVHRDHRNALFFDMHVSPIDLDRPSGKPPSTHDTNYHTNPETPTPTPSA